MIAEAPAITAPGACGSVKDTGERLLLADKQIAPPDRWALPELREIYLQRTPYTIYKSSTATSLVHELEQKVRIERKLER